MAKRNIQMNKKGSARDVILIAVILFSFAITFLIFHFMMDKVVDQIIAVPQINESEKSVEAFTSIQTKIIPRLDYAIFGLFLGLLFALMISSWFVGGNPIFMFIYFIVVVIGVVISTILANTWDDLASTITFAGTRVAFPITDNLISFMPYYIAVIGFIGLIIMFAKPFIQQRTV